MALVPKVGFKKRFVEPILIGTKVHTLRVPPKREPKIGETLFMYTGLRTKHCEFITDKEKLISKQKAVIIIRRKPMVKGLNVFVYDISVSVDRRILSSDELEIFVQYDGFKNVADFCNFWFIGEKKTKRKVGGLLNLYHWTDLRY